MTLKINSMYNVGGAFIIPRSHFKSEKGIQYAIFERIVIMGSGFETRHITLTRAEIKNALELSKNERVEII